MDGENGCGVEQPQFMNFFESCVFFVISGIIVVYVEDLRHQF